MTEELLKKLHTAMCNVNEHQCNILNNYIHTDKYLTAEVVQVVNEIVAEETKELKEQNKELTLKVSRLESDCDAYNYSQRTYQEEIKELKAQIEKMKCCGNCKQRELIRERGQWKERFNCKGNGCVCYSKWEIKEK